MTSPEKGVWEGVAPPSHTANPPCEEPMHHSVVRRLRGRAALALSLAAITIPLVSVPPAAADERRPPPRPWEAYNYSPQSRTVAPAAVYAVKGEVTDPQAVLKGRSTTLSGAGASVTL